ncbi:MAG: glycosyltransferase [Solirubrobacterales bacterium]|nr:glycosyltransferase [Solirubrobacterales bacterium]
MKVLIFHGYLLRGTGSNVYNASLATALARLGHEVHLVCQDREATDLGAGAPGSVTIHNPDIGGLLPVFVRDTYEGFEVKTFAELSDTELASYLEANVVAVRDLVAELGGVDAALGNHLVMGPVILARAGLEYAIKVHGSDLSYTVLPDLERFGPYAVEAVSAANGILVGSVHIADRLLQAVDDPAINAKVRLGPPGVDTTLFAPMPPADRPARLRELAAQLRPGEVAASTTHEATAWDRDVEQAADAIDWFADSEGPRAIFVGKLIVSKGVDLLLAAWPLIHSANPGARLLIVGFGSYEDALRRLCSALERGDLAEPLEIAARGRADEGGEVGRLEMLAAFLADPPSGYAEAAAGAAGSVRFAGRLEHDEVATPVAASDALVFPSTFPEAFGMVAAEAAAAGALPVAAAHSGALEVSRELAADLPAEVAGLVSFPLGVEAVASIADRVNAWLALSPAARETAGEALRETTERLWSWQGVARTVLAASAGELDGLAPIKRA